MLHLSIIQTVMKRKTEKQTCDDLKERALISHTDFNICLIQSFDRLLFKVIQLLLSRPVCNLYSCYKFASVSHENHTHF